MAATREVTAAALVAKGAVAAMVEADGTMEVVTQAMEAGAHPVDVEAPNARSSTQGGISTHGRVNSIFELCGPLSVAQTMYCVAMESTVGSMRLSS